MFDTINIEQAADTIVKRYHHYNPDTIPTILQRMKSNVIHYLRLIKANGKLEFALSNGKFRCCNDNGDILLLEDDEDSNLGSDMDYDSGVDEDLDLE
jgi:hypothetical protein